MRFQPVWRCTAVHEETMPSPTRAAARQVSPLLAHSRACERTAIETTHSISRSRLLTALTRSAQKPLGGKMSRGMRTCAPCVASTTCVTPKSAATLMSE